MKATCYFCDTELSLVAHTFKIGTRDEPVCDDCYVKTVNRKKALGEDAHRP
ncbi:MAG TPA: hypothetical protein VEJ36_07515 [Nitrososphaerales archaeon]|nr:hypothetical protein [Nitrososphaerales archaeon]